ncbi:hypothetical protein [Clostridium intestinale]|uniref:Uncharacterized protein n=1 Tax=Clostridium intestinale DSM 6191 TaxID=1121320 RepID=A0A1M5ZQS5_9CLOT|nr:hypothetical protein [Clostridium intestinale]SHI26544.1 hypothetical protein SAMN02745941_03262 [Clostridium intestinale DSM 6191]
MEYYELKEQFLNNCTDGEFYDSSITTYKRKLDVFFEFLTDKYGINDTNYKVILKGIDSGIIAQSVEFYVDRYGISFKSTINTYISVIKSFFDYLSHHLYIVNEYFDSNIGYSHIKDTVNRKIKDLKLMEVSDKKPPSAEYIFLKALNACDNIIDNCDYEDFLLNKDKPKKSGIPELTSAIITKLVMFLGLKNQVIGSIKLGDYNEDLNTIKINKFSIHLPNKLAYQMKFYLKVRKLVIDDIDKGHPLFVRRYGEGIGTTYSTAFKVLKKTLGSSASEGLAKYTIIQMIKKGMNISLIKTLTKFGLDSCLQCQEIVSDEEINRDITVPNREVDSKIRNMDIYDIF